MKSDRTKNKKDSKLLITVIICASFVLVSGIGAWVFVYQQDIAQRDKELQQQKELTEYEQEQINNRASEERRNERLYNNSGCEDWFSGC
jgi:flagellar basal body-associated protein FliL